MSASAGPERETCRSRSPAPGPCHHDRDLWFALNNCYTLNPRHRNEQRGKSQLDQVADRQPQILLINIGSNEGLFMAGFAGDFSDQTLRAWRRSPNC